MRWQAPRLPLACCALRAHILACEGDSKWVFFHGNCQEYEANKERRLCEEGARPKRVRFMAQN